MACRAEAGEVAAPLARDVNVRLSEPLEIEPYYPFQGLAIANSLNLAAVITRQGTSPLETHTGFDLHHLDSLRATFQSADRNSCPRSQPFYSQSTSEHAKIHFVSFVGHASRLLCGLSDGTILLYDSPGQDTCRQIAAPSSNLAIKDIKPNPGDHSDLCLVTFAANPCDSNTRINGSIYVLDVRSGNWLANLSVAGVTSSAWSTKGKQLVVGLYSGELVQFTPEGEEKARLPPPPDMDRPVYVEDVLWLENHVFLTTYNTHTDELVHEYDVFVVLRDPKASKCTYAAFPLDVAPPFGDTSRLGQRYTAALRTWGQEKHLVFMTSAPSTDVGVLSCKEGKVGPNSWNALELEETSRPVLPFSSVDESTDTSPVGLQFDLTATESVEDPNAAAKGEDLAQKLPAMPILLVYTNDGVLLAYNVVNTSTNEPYPGMVQSDTTSSAPVTEVSIEDTKTTSEPVIESMKSSRAVQDPSSAQASDSPFGQQPSSSAASVFGASTQPKSSVPAFGSASSFGSAAKPSGTATFGTSSAFGSQAKSSSTPTFGSSSAFGPATKTSGASVFGSTSAFGAPSAFGSASKPASQNSSNGGFQAFGAGQSSFGEAHKSETVSNGTKPAFASTQSNTSSAFGSVPKATAFGSSSTPSGFGSSTSLSAFSSNAKPSAFGTNSPSSDLQTSSDTPAFGKPAFGQASAFGSTNSFSSAFGNVSTKSPASTTNIGPTGSAFGKTSSTPSDTSKSAFGSASGPSSAFGAIANPESKSIFGSGGGFKPGAPAFQNATKTLSQENRPAEDDQATASSSKDTSAFSFSNLGNMLESGKTLEKDRQGTSLQSVEESKNSSEKTQKSPTTDEQASAAPTSIPFGGFNPQNTMKHDDAKGDSTENTSEMKQSSNPTSPKHEPILSEVPKDRDASDSEIPTIHDQKNDSNQKESVNPSLVQMREKSPLIGSNEHGAPSKESSKAKNHQDQSQREDVSNDEPKEDESLEMSGMNVTDDDSQTAKDTSSATNTVGPQKQSPARTSYSASESEANNSNRSKESKPGFDFSMPSPKAQISEVTSDKIKTAIASESTDLQCEKHNADGTEKDTRSIETPSSNDSEDSKEEPISKPPQSTKFGTIQSEDGKNMAAAALDDSNEQKTPAELSGDTALSNAGTNLALSSSSAMNTSESSDKPKASDSKPYNFAGFSNKDVFNTANETSKPPIRNSDEKTEHSKPHVEKLDRQNVSSSSSQSTDMSSASSSLFQAPKTEGYNQPESPSSSSNGFSFNKSSQTKPGNQSKTPRQSEIGIVPPSDSIQPESDVTAAKQPKPDSTNLADAQSNSTFLDETKSAAASSTGNSLSDVFGAIKPGDNFKSTFSAAGSSENTQQSHNIPATKTSNFSLAHPFSTNESGSASVPQTKSASLAEPAATDSKEETTSEILKLGEIKLPAIRLPSLPTPALSGEGDELQREFAKIYLSVNRELDALHTIATENSKLYHRLQQRSNTDRNADHLKDPEDWSFGDLHTLNSIELELDDAIRNADHSINNSQQRVAGIQSAQLKAEIKRDETWRFLRARKDASFAKLVHVRHLGPAHLENQQRLRRASHVLRERMQELGDYFQTIKTALTNDKLGRKSMQAPALDSVYRSAEHISMLAHRRLDELDKLSLELQALRPKDMEDFRTQEESVATAPRTGHSPLSTVQEMNAALPAPNEDAGKGAEQAVFFSAMQKLIRSRESPVLTKVNSEPDQAPELLSHSVSTPVILKGRRIESLSTVSAKTSPTPHEVEAIASERQSPKSVTSRPDFLAVETPDGTHVRKPSGVSVFGPRPKDKPSGPLQPNSTAQYTTFEGLVQPRRATSPADLTLEQYVQQAESGDEDDDNDYEDEYGDEYGDEDEDEYENDYEDDYDEEYEDQDDDGGSYSEDS